MLNCLIIDDEELARGLIKSYINKLDFLEVVADFENPLDAMAILQNQPIDVIFLDIQMPYVSGRNYRTQKGTFCYTYTQYIEYLRKMGIQDTPVSIGYLSKIVKQFNVRREVTVDICPYCSGKSTVPDFWVI